MKYFELINDLENSIANPTVISIDGVAGSGKTTLAKRIVSELPGTQVIHMDDLYDGWNNPLSEELSNRIRNQILLPMLEKRSTIYKKYDWALARFNQEVGVSINKYLILEGVGSGQKAFRDLINLAIWIEYDPDMGLERVIKRDGEAIRNEMIKFLVDQDQHFRIDRTRNFAHYTFNGAP